MLLLAHSSCFIAANSVSRGPPLHSKQILSGYWQWRSTNIIINKIKIKPFCTVVMCSSDKEFVEEEQNGKRDIDPCIISLKIEPIGKNQRRIEVSVAVDAPLESVWNVITNYGGLSDFLPGLAVCEVRERWENGAQLFQIGEQNLALGLKFKAKGIINVQEKPLELLPWGIRRDISFEMIEGDFAIFKGTWRLEQGLVETNNELSEVRKETVLSYLVDIQPKAWLPVRLVEGRLSSEIQSNLICVRNEVMKNHRTMSS